jgi:hypothetical protein
MALSPPRATGAALSQDAATVSQYVYPLQHCKPVCSRPLEPHAASTQTPCRLYAGQRLPAAARQQSAPSLLNLHGQRKKHHPTAIALSHWPLLARCTAVPGQRPSALLELELEADQRGTHCIISFRVHSLDYIHCA